MSVTNCLQFLAQYAEYLNLNPSIQGPRPHPFFWSGINCTGTAWPTNEMNWNTEPADGVINPNPVGSQFGSMYIPAGWSVVLYVNANESGTFPASNFGQDTGLPLLIADTSSTTLSATDGTIIKDTIIQAIVNSPRIFGTTLPYTVPNWQLDMCINNVSTVIGAQHLTSYQAGSLIRC